jgi:putative SOS response-associated peptidase YedK
MCGRYATSRSSADLSALFDAFDEGGGLSPDYNLAPTDPGPIVRMSERLGGRVLSVARAAGDAASTSPSARLMLQTVGAGGPKLRHLVATHRAGN